MEFELPSMLTFISSALLLYILSKFLKHPKPKIDSNRIPGPKKLPLIGNLHHLLGKSPSHRIFRQMASKFGPLMSLQLGDVPCLVVSSVDVAKEVLKTNDVVFANRPHMHAVAEITYGCTDIALAPYGEYWRHMRKLCTLELLSGRRVGQFRPIREEENAATAEWIAASEGLPVNLSKRIGLSAFNITCRAAVGREVEKGQVGKGSMATAMKAVIGLAAGLSVVDLYPSNKLLPFITGVKYKIWRVFRQMDRIFESIIIQHRVAHATRVDGGEGESERSEDLVDILFKCQEDSRTGVRISDDNIKVVIVGMFFAGTETSATVIEWTMSELIRNPTYMKKAQEEVRRVFDDKGYVDEEKFDNLKYLKLVIKEAMRLHMPLPLLLPRLNKERCEINGYEVPANTKVMVNAWALSRDPKYWGDDAEEFKPQRFKDSSMDFKGNNLEFIPFGAGRRMCPGMTFGLASVEMGLATLLYHFNWKTPTGIKNEDLDMTEAFGASARRKHDLVLIPTTARPLRRSIK